MAEVALVQMPYAAVHHPSLALGLLKSCLRPARIEAEVVYANVLWAEDLGLDVYLVLQESFTNDLLGEWTFAALVGRPVQDDFAAYRSLARNTFDGPCLKALTALHPQLDLERLLGLVRARAARFVDRLADQVLASGARVVGCSSTFQQHCASLALLRRVREKDASVVTLLGGANCEGPMGAATHRAFPWVDFVARGEVDDYIAGFCRDLLEHGRRLAPERLPDGVLGPAHREGQATAARPARFVTDMDTTAVPDYADYFACLQRSPIGAHVRPGLLIETSRGCWYGARRACAFCGLNGDRLAFRSKSAGRVRSELEQLSARHDVRHLAAVDNILDLDYLEQVLPHLSTPERRYEIFFEVRPNLGRAQIERLASAGARWLQAGLEHLHDEVLARVAKGTSALQNVAFLKWARRAGVHVAWNLLYGAPGERDEWYDELAAWLPLISHLQPPTGMAQIRFDRFSRYHLDAAAHGLELEPYPTYAHVYGLPAQDLADLAYFFVDRRLQAAWRAGQHGGLNRTGALIGRWRVAFWQAEDSRPSLTLSPAGDALRVRDSRAIAPAPEQTLSGLAARALEQCAQPSTLGTLLARLAGCGVSASTVQLTAALDELVQRRLVLSLGQRYLALPLPEPVRALPPPQDAPEGFISMAQVLTRWAGTSLARQAVKPAWDLPVLTAFGARAALESR